MIRQWKWKTCHIQGERTTNLNFPTFYCMLRSTQNVVTLSLQYSQGFSFVTHSVGSTRMSSNSTPASANRIRMGSALALTGKYVSLYLAIARSSGDVNDSQPLKEWTSRNLTPLEFVLKYFYSIRLCERWHVHVKLESNILLQQLFVPCTKISLLRRMLCSNDGQFCFMAPFWVDIFPLNVLYSVVMHVSCMFWPSLQN